MEVKEMKLKKLVVAALASVMVMASTVVAFGAEISATEKSVIDALKDTGIATEYVTQAENYLKGHELTDAQAQVVVAEIGKAKETANGVTDINKFTSAQKSAILKNIETAAAACDLTVSVDSAKGIIRILDANGKVVAEATTSVVKDTGANMAVTVSVVSLLAVALIGCAVAGKKFAAR